MRKYAELPKEARDYIEYVEAEIGCRMSFISVGPERDAYCVRA